MAEEKKERKGFFKEFKEFITRGNVLDMAVGIIIGGAFTAIVTALTAGILQPLINWALGAIFQGDGLAAARTVLGGYVMEDGSILWSAAEVQASNLAVDWAATNYIDWGSFIGAIINFLLVALVLFIIIKSINRVHEAGVKAKEIAEKKVKKEEPKEEKAE